MKKWWGMCSLCKSFNCLSEAVKGITCSDSKLNASTSRLVYILNVLIFDLLSESCLDKVCKSDACSLIDVTTVSISVAEDVYAVQYELRKLVICLLRKVGLD